MSDIISIDMRKKAEEYKKVVEALDKIEYELLQLNILESKLRQQKLSLEKKRKQLEDEAILSTKDK
jgi:hypothetical protein